ncbi:HD domain-containing phosphohydrolase [Terasakiella sp. A23]|uniref:HD domain-containing phosphohydrolase n=1 Tax=Terasakiella sp. FCG-A23 TaxID=3080561 RepID=UPI00295317D9|nr:HD domain-containing phosphohydrolase [Terasakiella sp. A23]MDV7341612.1 HD domain-containing phosphohydrolase [Terasakiella sp. A23]
MDTAVGEDQGVKTANKTDIFIVSGNAKHLHDVSTALKSFYIVHPFNDVGQLSEALSAFHPTAIIIDEDIRPTGGLAILQQLRRTPSLSLIPVVFTAKKSSLEQIQMSKTLPLVRTLVKPYRFSALLKAISDQVNAHVEAQWEMMEPTQKAALENTLSSFNSVADLIAEGKELPYDEIQDSCEPLVEAVQSGNFKDLLQGVKGHDNYSYVHSLRVATFLSLFGDHVGIKGNDMSILATGGVLHDVGKMMIPHQVLNKPGRLDDDELVVMRSHVTETIDFLENTVGLPRGVTIIASQHHEKIDGTGYPYGLKGKELNELARMAAIIDIFSALTDRRVYKDPMSPVQAMDIMEDMGPSHLDQHFLLAFKELLLDATSESGMH